MPLRPMVPCRAQGCRALVVSGWCLVHKKDDPAQIYEHWRGSSTKRGYGYRWHEFRAALLKQPDFVLCRDCEAEGKITLAQEIHHPKKVADYPELQYDPANCMPLCKTHHAIRTARGE